MSPVMLAFQKRHKAAVGSSIWVDVEDLTEQLKAVNFGQGYPDFPPPDHVTTALHNLVKDETQPLLHQYTRSWGHPRLVSILATIYSHEFNRDLNPKTNVLVTVGATHGLVCSIHALIEPGDEVIIFQPFYDAYEAMVRTCGGVPVYVNLNLNKRSTTHNYDSSKNSNGDNHNQQNGLHVKIISNNDNHNNNIDHSNDSGSKCTSDNGFYSFESHLSSANFKFEEAELASKFTKKTKLLIVNTPHNPLGKVFSLDELKVIARLCIKHNVRVISDEVYERLVHPPCKHISVASLPGMWDRTLKIANAGKSLSVTGWKVGWCVGPTDLIKMAATVHEDTIYACPTILQEAVAISLEQEFKAKNDKTSYFNSISDEIVPKMNQICEMVRSVGMVPIVPEGGYFVVTDISNLDFREEKNGLSRDIQFIKWLLINKKVAVLPLSIFYNADDVEHANHNLIRICCFKKEESLNRAHEIFKKWGKSLKPLSTTRPLPSTTTSSSTATI